MLSKGIDYDIRKDCFNLYWDNDIVSLTREDVIELIPILERFIGEKK